MFFLYTLKRIEYKIVHLTLSVMTTGAMFKIAFFFTSPEYLEAFQNFLNGGQASMSFAIENKKQSRMSFLDVQVICEDKIFTK